MFQCVAEVLKFTMAGFGVQEEPYFTEKLNDSVTSLFKALKDPSLPLMEMQVCVWGGGWGGGEGYGVYVGAGEGGGGFVGQTSFLLISQELMSAISSRIPTSVEEAIQSSLAHYANNLTSVLCQFPSQQVRGEWGSM